MGLTISSISSIEGNLRGRGYRRRQWRKGAGGTRVWGHQGTHVVTIATIELPPHAPANRNVAIDDWFRRLQGILKGLHKNGRITDLVLPGGGTIPVPEWFKAWCAENGIRLHIDDGEIDPEKIGLPR